MSAGILDLLKEAKRPERTHDVCLRADLFAALEELTREGMSTVGADSFDGKSVEDVEAQAEAIKAQMRDATVTFRLRALGRIRAATLMADHPPREGNADDDRLGFNRETAFAAWIRETTVSIERGGEVLDASTLSAEDWDGLFDALNNRQFDALFDKAWSLDQGEFLVPPLPRVSPVSQRTDASSKQHGAGESAPESSQAKPAARSRRTSTTKKAASPAQ